jgi:D-glycero-D-manno-heptose 1,7-bisphosphate phosphatase
LRSDADDAAAVGDVQAVILVGGRGTRLGSLTDRIPKPLLDVGGRPFVEHLIGALAGYGVRRVVLLAGWLGEQIESLGARAGALGVQATCIVEPEPAGTAGALIHARHLLDPQFLLLNGDSLFDLDHRDLVHPPLGESDSLGRIALRRVGDASRYGAVTLSGERITAFAERPPEPGPGLINGGVYWLDRRVLDRVTTLPCSLERDVLPVLSAEGRLLGRAYDGYFIDIGIPADLERAHREIPARKTR